jgi:pyruvate,water dikinase
MRTQAHRLVPVTTIDTRYPFAPAHVVPVRLLSELSIADVAYAGGKGANLGQLMQLGFPVPSGFVVGAPAYAAFRAQSGLGRRLDQLLSGVDPDDRAALERAAHEARTAVAESELPGWLATAIRAAYDGLARGADDVPCAVRSSATVQDTAAASFAGMSETSLNVHGREAVLHAVKDCWAALFAARTIERRCRRGARPSEVEIAVVVQRQIAATRAGMMYTIDVASGDRDRLVVEAAFGLGEAVASGQVSPDRYVVDKRRMKVLTRSVRAKQLAIEPADRGGTYARRLTAEDSRRPALSDEEALRLAELGVAIEHRYSSPQHAEWALDGDGRAWMLQTRSLT